MVKRQNYYKVVRVINNKLFSSSVVEDNCMLEYKINKWTKPLIENSKLFIFNNREACRSFKRNLLWDSKYYIYKVDVINPEYKDLYDSYDNWGLSKNLKSIRVNTRDRFFRIWNNFCLYSIYTYKLNFLSGTLMVDAVKLLERIR
jgi:hypothetical protein